MSEIRSINNFVSNSWSVALKDISYSYVNLYIGFSNNEPVVTFNNLSFGYELLSTGSNVSKTYPNEGITYDSSDQTYLTIDTLYLKPETEYTLNLWSINNGIECRTTEIFTTPVVPPQPTPGPPSGSTITSGITIN